jgi:hypothetical protein
MDNDKLKTCSVPQEGEPDEITVVISKVRPEVRAEGIDVCEVCRTMTKEKCIGNKRGPDAKCLVHCG